jgi:hypothetical protein
MDRKERNMFYRNAFKVIKSGGYFSVYGIYLVCGKGLVHQSEERKALENIGFKFVANYQCGLIVQKPLT